MLRAPLTNQLPDFVVLDAAGVAATGVAAIVAAGFFANDWSLDAGAYIATCEVR